MAESFQSKITINLCLEILARFGLPKIIISDNETTFVSGTLQSLYDIVHKTIALYDKRNQQ